MQNKRLLKNVEIANYVFERMKGKIEYNKILGMVDDSITYNNDFKKDENGEIANTMTESEIQDLKNKMLDGIETYYEYLRESKNEKF